MLNEYGNVIPGSELDVRLTELEVAVSRIKDHLQGQPIVTMRAVASIMVGSITAMMSEAIIVRQIEIAKLKRKLRAEMRDRFRGEVLCYRIGDGDIYRMATKSLEEFAESLRENEVDSIQSYNEYGVESAEFRNNNYISVYFVPYHGNAASDPTRGLSAEEIEAINDYLRLLRDPI